MGICKLILFGGLLAACVGITSAQSKRVGGIDLYQAGEFSKAASALMEAVEANKKDDLAWIYLGASLLRSGSENEARSAFKKAKVRGKEMVDGYEQPLRLIAKPHARYTDSARRNFTTGRVELAVEFGADGKIGFVFPVRTLGDGLTEQCVAAARLIKFTPAIKSGKPVTTVELITYSFDIR